MDRRKSLVRLIGFLSTSPIVQGADLNVGTIELRCDTANKAVELNVSGPGEMAAGLNFKCASRRQRSYGEPLVDKTWFRMAGPPVSRRPTRIFTSRNLSVASGKRN